MRKQLSLVYRQVFSLGSEHPFQSARAIAFAGMALVILTDGALAEPGKQLWDSSYGDTAGADGGDGVSINTQDSSGNVYAAGNEWIGNGTNNSGRDAHAVKYDSAGNMLNSNWPLIYDSAITYSSDQFIGAEIDSEDHLILAGKGQNNNWTACEEIFIGKYDASGVQQWRHEYGSSKAPPGDPNPGFWDCWHTLYSVDTDASNNIYAAGLNFTGWGTGYYHDWIVLKFDSAGTMLPGFPFRYSHPVTQGYYHEDIAFGIASNGMSEFTVSGRVGISSVGTDRTFSDYDWHVRHYEHVDGIDPDSDPDTVNLLWEDTFSGPTNRNDVAYKPVFDSQGDIVVSGYLNKGADNGSNVNYDWQVIKYAGNGDGLGNPDRLWTRTFESAEGRSEAPGLAALAVDEKDNIYIGGYERDAMSKLHWRLEYLDGSSGDLLSHWVWNDIEGGIASLSLRKGRLAITGGRNNGTDMTPDTDWYTVVYDLNPDSGFIVVPRRNGGAIVYPD